MKKRNTCLYKKSKIPYQKSIQLLLLLLVLLPLASAQALQAFEEFFYNPVTVMITLCAIIFLFVYQTLLRSQIGENRAMVMLISFSISLIATYYITQSDVFILASTIGFWIAGIALAILFVFGKVAYRIGGLGGILILASISCIAFTWISTFYQFTGFLLDFSNVSIIIAMPLMILGIMAIIHRRR